jgi:integrase
MIAQWISLVENPGSCRESLLQRQRSSLDDGSSYAAMGAGQKVIGALLGHSDSASTERYTHVAPCATTATVEARWLRLCGRETG